MYTGSVLVCLAARSARALYLGILASSAAFAIAPTTTNLAISPSSPVSVGTVVTLTARVTSAGADVTRGSVIFCNAAAVHCEDAAILGQAQLTSAGSAILKLRLGVGTHSIRAAFQGTTLLGASQSAAATLAVSGSSRATVKSAASGTEGAITLTGSVGVFGTGAPTGTLSFLDAAHGNAPLGSVALDAAASVRGFDKIPGPTLFMLTMVAGDFNGDGIQDFAVSDGDQGVLVYVGVGDGTFTFKSHTITGREPLVVQTADFNGDGIADLAIVSETESQVFSATILLGNGDATFVKKSSSAVGKNSMAIAIGDFNGDGIPDMAVASQDANTVTVLLGNGDGTFAFGSSPAPGRTPNSISVADLNGDGILDLLTANRGDGSITVLLGKGDGTFESKNPLQVAGVWSAAVADLDGDGIPDLVTNNFGQMFSLSILLGKGDGTFVQKSTLIPASSSVGFSLGDFNGDGVTDIVLENDENGNLTLILGNGDGTFTSLAPLPLGGNVFAQADFNGDGVLDLVGGNSSADALLANLTSTVSENSPLAGGSYQIVASYSGDSNYLAASSPPFLLNVAGPVAPVFNLPSGTYQFTQQVSLSDATLGAVIHYTLDGTLPTPSSLTYTSPIVITWDATINAIAAAPSGAYSSVATGTYSIVRPLPASQFNPPSGTYPAGQSITLSDDPGYCGQHGAICDIYYTLNGSTPTTSSKKYSGPIVLQAPGKVTIKAIATSHHFLPSPVASATYAYEHTATATNLTISPAGPVSIGSVVTLTASVTSGYANVTRGLVIFCNAAAPHCEDTAVLGQAQLTSDGLATLKLRLGVGAHSIRARFQATTRLAASQSAAGSLTVNLPSSTRVTVSALSTGVGMNSSANLVQLSSTVSFFGTGTPAGTLSFLDASHGNASLGSVTIEAANTSSGFAQLLGPLPGRGNIAESITVGDFNRDGIPDLAIPVAAINEVWIYLGVGDGTFTFKFSIPAPDSPAVAAVGDFNGDGIADLATVNPENNSVTIFLGNGDGTFITGFSSAVGNNPLSIVIADFNSDGIPDIATANANDNTVTILLGTGDGTFQFAASPATGTYPLTISVADLNGDGILDLVTANTGGTLFDDNSATLLLGNGDGTFTSEYIPTLRFVTGAAIGDFNGDGIPDLALTSSDYFEAAIEVMLGNGDGTFTQTPLLEAGVDYLSGVFVGDFNGDGLSDIAGQSSNSSLVYYGLQGGSFTNASYLPLASLSEAVADINGDGISDIVGLGMCANDYYNCLLPGPGVSPGDYYVTVSLAALTSSLQLTTSLAGGAYQIVASYTGNSDYAAGNSPPFPLVLDPPADPVFNPPPGLYQWTQQVSLTEGTPGAVIHYSLDGTPATPSSPTYVSPITVTWDGTISAIAVAASGAYSNVITGTYTVDRPLPPPAFSLQSGTYSSPQSITLTDDPGYCGQHDAVCEIYYTLNGTTPTTWGSTKYAGPITLGSSGTVTIKAIAISHHYVASTVASETYTLQ